MLGYLQRSWRPSLAFWGPLGAILGHLGRSDRSRKAPSRSRGRGYRRGRRELEEWGIKTTHALKGWWHFSPLLWDRRNRLLGPSGAPLGRFLESSEGVLGVSWQSREPVGASWLPLGGEGLLRSLEGLFEATLWQPLWFFLGAPWAPLGALLET